MSNGDLTYDSRIPFPYPFSVIVYSGLGNEILTSRVLREGLDVVIIVDP